MSVYDSKYAGRTKFVTFESPAPKRSDELSISIAKNVGNGNKWFLLYSVNEYGRIIVKATKVIETNKSLSANDGAKVEFTIQTPENKVPRIKVVNTTTKGYLQDPDYVEIDDNRGRETESFKGQY
jgi:hypothetical protein